MNLPGRSPGSLDELDRSILSILAADGRIAMKEIARKIGLSAPATAERVRRLEDIGVILGYAAKLDPSALGFPVAIYIRIRPVPGKLHDVVELLSARPEITSCDRVTGDDCLVAKAILPSVAHLEGLIDLLLPIAHTTTSLIQSTPIAERLPNFADAKPALVRSHRRNR
ncbi:MAG: Lrp/AsnC family transcriptional regulator [Phenylobacterium sp.]|uniref:Lrp/AsnC family transcriptional regulator n=1 Tax=Phenylobacterium sp. TaxID=1871053 RepID=UPI003BB5BB04